MEISQDRSEELCKQAHDAFKRKENLDNFWQTTAELHYPERADFETKKTLGEDFCSGLYASDPIIFRRDFGNFIGAVLRPKGREWFKPRARRKVINDRANVQTWLVQKGEDTRSLLYDTRSQFIRSMREADHDWVAFGNSVQTVEEYRTRNGFLWRTWHLRDCAWLENYDGEVDTMFRKFEIPIRVLPERARTRGWNISPKATERLRRQPDSKIEVLHIVMPYEQFVLGTSKDVRVHDWVSIYLDRSHKHTMSIKQVPWFPYVVSRWFTISGSPYAFSPCVVASTPDARVLQTMTWTIMEAGEKAVEPPLIGTHEAIIGAVDIRAGHVTWADRNYDEKEGAALRALELGKHPELGEALRQGMRGTLMEAWYLNKLFLPPPAQQPMTAQESAQRHEEFLRASTPIIEPAEEERNGKPLDLVMSMAMELGYWGDLNEMPEELKGENVDLTYDNPIEDARRQSKTLAFGQVVQLNEAGKTLDPTLAAHLDANKAFRDAIAGVAPPDWLVSEDEAAERAAELGQGVDEQAGLDQAGQLAAIAAEASKAMPQPEAA